MILLVGKIENIPNKIAQHYLISMKSIYLIKKQQRLK
jgi:hypothetical protein